MNKKTVRDYDLRRKRVLLRADFNVPLKDGRPANDRRIRLTLPTLRYLLERGCAVIACSHLGRPKGKVVEELRMAPVARRLEELLGFPVPVAPCCVGPEVERMARAVPPGRLLLLENLRFHPEEERNDPSYAQSLARLAEVFVQDAFGTAHRAHASTEGVARYLPAVAGLLLEQEVTMLERVLHRPERPLVAVLGGAKVSDKARVLERLVERVDRLLIGGAMANTFLRARGLSVGRSRVEEDLLDLAREVMERAQRRGVDLLLPVDAVVAERLEAEAPRAVVPVEAVPAEAYILDIGPATVERFRGALQGARTVFWNGPMGVYEWPAFAEGTRAVARALADLEGATTVVGGGETADVVEDLGLVDRLTWVSTGGGAVLEFLEGRDLPGIAALLDREGT